jgi:radical SAM protein with 4Fe4S-binding SPASM domain
MRTETSLVCNIGCRYCNGASGTPPPGEISFDEIKDVIAQVKELGGESVVVIGGGEPTIYPHFHQLIQYINGQDMVPVVITNTVTMTVDLAQFLYDENVSVLGKLDSLVEEKQDFLANRKGTYRRIRRGIDNLLRVGYADGTPQYLRLGLSFVTTALTVAETPAIWRFCRDHNFYPNQEVLVPRGRALTEMSDLMLTKQQVNAVKSRLLEIDEAEYGYTWLVHAPLTGNGCLQHMYSIYLTSKGYVGPCADVHIEQFNVADMTIKAILDTPFFQRARHIEKYLTGKCDGCEYGQECVGCRGMAFLMGVNEGLGIDEALSREDPLCAKTLSKNDNTSPLL